MYRKIKNFDRYALVKEPEASKIFLPSSIIKPLALFEYLVVNNQFAAFRNVFIALRIYLMPVIIASSERSFLKPNQIKKHTYGQQYRKRD